MRLIAVRSFWWEGVPYEPGTPLTVASERDAHQLVHGYRYCRYTEAEEPTVRPSAMVVNADPVAEHRDPIVAPNAAMKRRKR